MQILQRAPRESSQSDHEYKEQKGESSLLWREDVMRMTSGVNHPTVHTSTPSHQAEQGVS